MTMLLALGLMSPALATTSQEGGREDKCFETEHEFKQVTTTDWVTSSPDDRDWKEIDSKNEWTELGAWWNFSPDEVNGRYEGPPDFPTDSDGTWHPHTTGGPGQNKTGTYRQGDGNGNGNGSWFHREFTEHPKTFIFELTEYQWSTETEIEGWTKTDQTKQVEVPCDVAEARYMTVAWKVVDTDGNGDDWEQTYVSSTATSTPDLNALDHLLVDQECTRYQVDVYKYTEDGDRADVDALIAGGALSGPSNPVNEPLIAGGAGTAWKLVGDNDGVCADETPPCPTNYFEQQDMWEVTWGRQFSDTDGVPTFTMDSYGGLTSLNGGSVPSYMTDADNWRWLYVTGDNVETGRVVTYGFEDGTTITATVSGNQSGCPMVDWVTTPPDSDPNPDPVVSITDTWDEDVCGTFTVTVKTTDVPDSWKYGVTVFVDGTEVGEALVTGTGDDSYVVNLPEDANNGSAEVTYYVTDATEWDLVDADLNYQDTYPEPGDQVRTRTLDTDCEGGETGGGGGSNPQPVARLDAVAGAEICPVDGAAFTLEVSGRNLPRTLTAILSDGATATDTVEVATNGTTTVEWPQYAPGAVWDTVTVSLTVRGVTRTATLSYEDADCEEVLPAEPIDQEPVGPDPDVEPGEQPTEQPVDETPTEADGQPTPQPTGGNPPAVADQVRAVAQRLPRTGTSMAALLILGMGALGLGGVLLRRRPDNA